MSELKMKLDDWDVIIPQKEMKLVEFIRIARTLNCIGVYCYSTRLNFTITIRFRVYRLTLNHTINTVTPSQTRNLYVAPTT